ncbi:unnamed protein product, partial [Polarella glacialis]
EPPVEDEAGVVRNRLLKLEEVLFGDEDEDEESCDVKQLLHSIQCSSQAFVVFETESGRDAAVEVFSRENVVFRFRGQPVTLQAATQEPQGIYW